MGASIRAGDWTSTPLGPLDQWPPALRALTRAVLESPAPTLLGWGDMLSVIPNDACCEAIQPCGQDAASSPPLLGRPLRELVKAEGRETFLAAVEQALQGAPQRLTELPFCEADEPENDHLARLFDHTLSPLRDDEGRIAGVLHTVTPSHASPCTELEACEPGTVEASPRAVGEAPPEVYVATLDEALRFTFVCNSVQQLSGKPPAHFLGKRPRETVWASMGVADTAEATIRRVFETGEEQRFTYAIQRPDGEHRRLARVYPAACRGGRIAAVSLFCSDEGEPLAMRHALQESEERLRLVLEHSREGVHMLDLASQRYVFMSPSQAELSGFSLEELRDLSWDEAFERLHPDDRESVRRYVGGVIAGEEPAQPMEYRWMRKDGVYRWFSDSRRAVRDEDGAVWALVGVTRDVTDRKVFEQELLQSKALIEAMDHAGHVVFSIKDKEGRITRLSQSFLELIGKRGEDVTGKTELEVCCNGGSRARMRNDAKVLRTGVAALFEETVETRLGRRDFLAVKNPYRDETGDIAGLVGVAIDITEQKLVKRRMQTAIREAERANAAKSEFLANMSHELRTPLNGLLGLLDLLLKTLEKPKNREYARSMKRAGEALRDIIDDILDISKIEAGRLELAPKPTPLRESLAQCLEFYAPLVQEKGLDWNVEFSRELPEYVLLDEARLHQVVRNLVANALKFTDDGGVSVRVTYEDADDPAGGEGGILRLAVKDTGIGIPKARQRELFQNFTQLDAAYDKRHAGAGLGLAICKNIVERMGGAIFFESEEGQGSTFTVTVAAPRTPPPEESPSWPEAVAGCRELRLLVVEDNAINQFLMRELLTEAGCEHHIAEDGAKALEALERAEHQGEPPYSLALMDINMPVMDGVQATRRIRASGERFATIPIIALTAYAMPAERDRFLAEGMDGYLAKPFTMLQLWEVVATLPAHRVRRLANSGGTAAQPPFASAPEAESPKAARARPAKAAGKTPIAATAESPKGSGGLLDEHFLRTNYANHPDILAALLGAFEEAYARDLKEIQAKLEAGAWSQAADKLHAFASGCGTIAMQHVAQLALAMERALRNGDHDAAPADYARLQRSVGESVAALREALQTLRG